MNRFQTIPINRNQPATEDWQERVRNVAAAMVEVVHTAASPEPVKVQDLRKAVIKAARMALADFPSGPMIETMLKNSGITDGKVTASPKWDRGDLPGMLRLTLVHAYPNWQDAIGAESVMAVVQMSVDVEVVEYWHGKIRATVEGMYELESGPYPLAGATELRARVVEDIGAALNPNTRGDSPELMTVQKGQKFYNAAGMLRVIIGALGLSYADPTTATTVRRLAGETLERLTTKATASAGTGQIDGEGRRSWTWQARLEAITQIFIRAHKSNPREDDDALRRRIISEFEKAFEPQGEDEIREMDIPRSDGQPGTTREEMAGPRTLYRIMLSAEDVNWHEPENGARARTVIEAAIDAELAAA